MQSLFDISMPAPYSYIVAVLVILGLLAIFAIIVRRVAAHGPFPENSTRGRGPRLGLVDTFDLDKDRQLVIVRRDNVEHLLMIGGTSDVVIETNIVRAIGSAGMREQNFANMASQSEPSLQSIPAETPPLTPPPPPAPLMPPAVTPRLRPQQPASAPYVPPVQPLRVAPEPELSAIPMSAPLPPSPTAREPEAPLNLVASQPVSSPIEQAAQSRQAINQNELVALAKRLEASIPSMAPRAEKQAASQGLANPPLKPTPMPQAQHVDPHVTEQSGSGVSLKPAAPAPSYVPETDPSRALRQAMAPQPPRPTPEMPVYAPEPTIVSDHAPEAQEPFPDLIPMSTPAQPVAAPPQMLPPETPKDRQAAALDENLRRLLGRKIEPRN